MSNTPSCIFGPIISRRFGKSLGIDLSPTLKQCNFDCLYCELSPSKPINKQNKIIPPETIINQLKEKLDTSIDVITITANGEPTLYPYLDDLIEKINFIKKNTKTLILSNSSTLTNTDVFTTLLKIDKVKLSLDAAIPSTFKKIDRPVDDISLEEIIKSLKKFSYQTKNELYIEILFVKNVNDNNKDINALNEVLKSLKNITRIDIGTIDRPPAYNVKSLDYIELYEIAKKFDPSLPIAIASRKNINLQNKFDYSEDEIIQTIQKRPLSDDDIKILFTEKSIQNLNKLLQENKVTTKIKGNINFYITKTSTQ